MNRPRTVNAALLLLGLSLAADVVLYPLAVARVGFSWSGLASYLVSGVLQAALIYLLATGRNWVRIVYCVVSLATVPFVILFILLAVATHGHTLGWLWSAALDAYYCVIAVLLLLHSSSDWFRLGQHVDSPPNKRINPAPEGGRTLGR